MTAARIPKKGEAAVALRLAGATNAEIVVALGIKDEAAVETAIVSALRGQLSEEDRVRARGLARMRYERLLRSGWQHATDPTDPQQLPFLRACREIIDKLVVLEGAAQPAEYVVHTPAAAEIGKWVEKMMATQLGDVIEADVLEEEPLQIEGTTESDVA